MSDSIESPMTFYRIDPDAPITEDTLVAIDQHSGGPRALVPVEPDYEAAVKKSREAMSWADEEVMEGRMNDFDWWDVILTAGIDAAYGIGGDDAQ